MARNRSVENLNDVLKRFEGAIKHPENYISSQPKHEATVTSCTKTLFDTAANHAEESPLSSTNPLSELITEGFDEEQIWQELELQNQPSVNSIMGNIARLVAGRSRIHLGEHTRQQTPENKEEEDDDGSEFDDDDDEEEEGEDEEGEGEEDEDSDGSNFEENKGLFGRTKAVMAKKKKASAHSDGSEDESDTNFDIDDLKTRTQKQKKSASKKAVVRDKGESKQKSIVDDDFFNLEDMERFLEMEDAKEERRVRKMDNREGSDDEEDEDDDDEEEVDFFDDAPSDDMESDEDDDEDDEVTFKHKSTRQFKYSDFFDAPGAEPAKPTKKTKKTVHFGSEENADDDKDGEEDEEEEGSDKDFDEESFEDADEDLLANLRKRAGGGNKDDLLLSNSESEGEDVDDILGGGKKKKSDKEKSSFERRQEKLKQRIDELEKSNMSEKSWQLIGEVGAAKRPENSLLEETLEFDVNTRPAPVITEETTLTLEGMIQQRILDQAWDDVQRKAKPKEEVQDFKKRVTLDQEKSKLSLGEIYEQEYIKQTQQEAEEEKEDPIHKEVKESMDSLFVKLDALSNFHFTPKPIMPEVKIISNTPAISMEEVTPVNVASSSLLAPEEVQEKEKRELKGKTEKTLTDRKRELRQKKLRQREKARDREKRERLVEKLKPGLGNKYSKKAALAKLEKNSKAPSSTTTIVKESGNKPGLKSSKAFFSKLQDEVTSHVQGFKEQKKKRNDISGTQLKM